MTSTTVQNAPLNMSSTFLIMLVMLLGGGVTSSAAQSSAPNTKRTELQRHDLSVPGRELIQVRVDFDPQYVSPRHTHFGEEIIYVIEGTLEYHVDGRPTAVYRAGEVLLVPPATIHWVKNIGAGNGAELATYIVEKGKPLVTPAK